MKNLRHQIAVAFFTFFTLVAFLGCSKDEDDTSGGFKVNFFSLEDDRQLGLQVKEEIESNPGQYPLLSESRYPEAYREIRRITNTVLESGKVQHRDDFVWEVKIIDDDVLNAFCTPGGYIYVYTGLIKFLDSEDQLAGVMGHEIAHADARHSTTQLTNQYGLSVLSEVILGENQGLLSEITKGLIGLSYSRKHEEEADEFSVIYLCPTEYNAAGAAGFFQKLLDLDQAGSTPEFLSTHPSPDNRVQEIEDKKTRLGGCDDNQTFDERYAQFKAMLP